MYALLTLKPLHTVSLGTLITLREQLFIYVSTTSGVADQSMAVLRVCDLPLTVIRRDSETKTIIVDFWKKTFHVKLFGSIRATKLEEHWKENTSTNWILCSHS